MDKRIGLIFNGVWSQQLFVDATPFKQYYSLLYIHDLADIDLSAYHALVVPFQSHHGTLTALRGSLLTYCRQGGRLALFGDQPEDLLPGMCWAERHVDNTWWRTHPDQPPITWTDESHPLYGTLKPRQRAWHHHGVYTGVPAGARILQRSRDNEIVTWQTQAFGGLVFASTKDPLVEHGIFQIRHLDPYLNAFTTWILREDRV